MPPENIRMYVLCAFYCNRLNVKFQVVILETVPGSDEVRECLSNYVFSMNDSKTAQKHAPNFGMGYTFNLC